MMGMWSPFDNQHHKLFLKPAWEGTAILPEGFLTKISLKTGTIFSEAFAAKKTKSKIVTSFYTGS
jgi:hypothetical protein